MSRFNDPYGDSTGSSVRRSSKVYVVGAIAAFITLVVLIGSCGYVSSFDAPEPGYIGVCQTGGTFQGDSGTCGIMQPGQGKKALGIANHLRQYPITQRNFTLSNAPGSEGPPVVLTTKDGKQVSVSVQFLFTLDRDHIEEFYKAYGLKEYGGHHVYESEGWVNFLRAEFSNVATQSLKSLVLSKTGAELNPAFAAAEAGKSKVDYSKLNAAGNLATVQSEAGAEFERELVSTLGGDFFTNVRVSSIKVDAPHEVQAGVNAAVAAKATEVKAIADGNANVAAAEAARKVSNKKADAERYQAVQEAVGLRAKANAYAKNPAKAQVDAIAALPEGLTTLIIGGKSSQLLSVGGK